MKISKREKYMLAVLAALLLAAGIFFLLVLTAMNRVSDKKEQLETLTQEQVNMQRLLENKTLETDYEEQRQQAGKNYDSFYSTLNSYTIDRILNELMDENSIAVRDLKISPYEPVKQEAQVTEEDALEDSAKKQDNLLLVSRVSISGEGTHDNILAFLNAMNSKSICLQVTRLTSSERQEEELKGQRIFTCEIQIYGIEEPKGVQGGIDLSTPAASVSGPEEASSQQEPVSSEMGSGPGASERAAEE